MAEKKKEEETGNMTVGEAGRKGGQKVRDLIRKGEEARQRMAAKK